MGNSAGGTKNRTLSPISPRILEAPKKLTSKYKFGNFLGRGTFSDVYEIIDKKTSEKKACKIIDRKKMELVYIENEVNSLKILSESKYIVKYYQHFITTNFAYIILEVLEGGELHKMVRNEGGMSEYRASKYLKSIVSAIQFMNSKGIIHRDIKPENLLFSTKRNNAKLKICDFGLAIRFSDLRRKSTQSSCGTRSYLAPEVIRFSEYSPAVDMWGIGVVMFIMLAGFHPFEPKEKTNQELLSSIKACHYNFEDSVWNDISEDAKDLIRKCLQPSSRNRITPAKFLEHSWIKKAGLLKTLETPTAPLSTNISQISSI